MSDKSKRELRRERQRELKRERSLAKRAAREDLISNFSFGMSVRQEGLVQGVVFEGPTNSGKSFLAVERLVEDFKRNPDGRFVFAGPLRMLAFENYEKLCGILGDECVGFVTGEEVINPDAHVLCCTVEMAPLVGDSIVVDECHWLVDPDRGQCWTRLLLSGKYSRIYAICAGEVSGIVTGLLSDAEHVEVVKCERLTPVSYEGCVDVHAVPRRSAVVAFSRKSVYGLAARIRKVSSLRVGVLYGAMPLEVRKEQIEKFVNGKFDVIVTTDVIGHGINLPVDNVIFAETEKFDGSYFRELFLWEAAQIAGRAGRYGMSSGGKVYALRGYDWYHADTRLVKNAALAASGKIDTGLVIDKALVVPSLRDIGYPEVQQLLPALSCWEKEFNKVMSNTDKPVCASSMASRKEFLTFFGQVIGCNSSIFPISSYAQKEKEEKKEKKKKKKKKNPFNKWRINIDDLWSISGAPLDVDVQATTKIIKWVNCGYYAKSDILSTYYKNELLPAIQWLENVLFHRGKHGSHNNVNEREYDSLMLSLENLYRNLEELSSVFVAMGTLGKLNIDTVRKARNRVVHLMQLIVEKTITNTKIGYCKCCGKPCPPWYNYCQSCYDGYYMFDEF